MKMSSELVWRVPFVLAAVGTLAWGAPSFLRHQAGIVVLPTVPTPAATVVADQRPLDIAAIFEAALFGQQARPAAPLDPQRTARPDLVLRGIFASSGKNSTALLDVDGRAGLYRTGMEIAPGLELTGISTDFVTVQDKEDVLTLYFDDVELAVTASEDPLALTPQTLHTRMGRDLVVPARYEKPGQPETTAEYIDYWRNRIKKNPQTVLDEIGLRPTDQGYVIADKHDVGVRLAGLKSGDLVRSVNGRAVGDPNEDSRFYDVIAGEGFARLEVERGGELLSFSFPLR